MMTATSVTPLIEPDSGQMRQHLEHLFGGFLDGRHDGLIEIAWTNSTPDASGKYPLCHARLFGTDEIDEAVEEAMRQNRVPNQNVYVGAALRKPGSTGRCLDDDFLAMPACYVDLDEAAATRAARARYKDCPPTLIVITGKHPDVRAQLWWRLDLPETDPERCKQQMHGLALALDGDQKVFNPSRVMRLGGSIAWPTKSGRMIEPTEVTVPTVKGPGTYLADEIARHYPPTPLEQINSSIDPADYKVEATGSLGLLSKLADGREQYMRNTLVVCLREFIGEYGAAPTPDELFDAAWPQYSRNVSFARDGRGAAEMLEKAKYTVRRFHQGVIKNARTLEEALAFYRASNQPRSVKASAAAPEQQHPGFQLLDWTAVRYEGAAPPIVWLCNGTIPLAAPVLFAAMGGLGKSYLGLDLGLQISVGVTTGLQPKTILGGMVNAHGTAVILSAEDSRASIHRRLNKIDPQHHRMRNPTKLIVVPLPDAGGPMPLIQQGRDGLAKTPAFDELKRQLAAIADLRLVIIDPLQAFVLADVTSDPAAGQFMWSCFAEICAATGATLIVSHHMRKDGLANIQSADDAREAIRGSTALVDGARVSYALWKAPEQRARALCPQLGVEFENGRIVNGAIVKANDETSWTVHTYVRRESGLLEDETSAVSAIKRKTTPSKTEAYEILTEAKRRSEDERLEPFSTAPQSGHRYIVPFIGEIAGLDDEMAKSVLSDWLKNSIIEVREIDPKTKKRGVYVVKFP